MEKEYQIIAVVVTYNRLELLKECLQALKSQTYRLSRIVVVDNHSTDGTADYLAALSADRQMDIILNTANRGGSAGFAQGVKQAALQHPDWIWVMDDDSIPYADALERLLPYAAYDSVGFVNSLVVWKDGAPHVMNIPTECASQQQKALLFADRPELAARCRLLKSASFVSLLIRGSLPWEIGLPMKDFFIWCDDVEYTERIISHGYVGLLAEDSVVLHKTAENYSPSLFSVPVSAAWKVYYGERNGSYMRRKRKGWLAFFFSQLNAFRLHAHHIRKRHLPADEQRELIRQSRKGLWDGFFFNPKADRME